MASRLVIGEGEPLVFLAHEARDRHARAARQLLKSEAAELAQRLEERLTGYSGL